jgi:hypothetical protein
MAVAPICGPCNGEARHEQTNPVSEDHADKQTAAVFSDRVIEAVRQFEPMALK